MHFSWHLRTTACLAVCGFLAACATETPSTGNPKIPVAESTAQLRPGDSLTVALQGVPDPSTNTVQIDEKGLITLPFVGSVTAGGISTAQLSARIRQTYVQKNIYTTVDVSVAVTERYVYVGGEVAHPGRIIWAPDLTATKAVQAAGGFTMYAKVTAINLVREEKSYSIDAKLAERAPAQDPKLMPGDSLQVSRSAF